MTEAKPAAKPMDEDALSDESDVNPDEFGARSISQKT